MFTYMYFYTFLQIYLCGNAYGRWYGPRKREGKEDLRKEHGEGKRKENAGYSEGEAAGKWQRVGGRSCKANHVWESSEGGSSEPHRAGHTLFWQRPEFGSHRGWLITTCDSRSTGSNLSSLCHHVHTPTQRHIQVVKINHEERKKTCSGKLPPLYAILKEGSKMEINAWQEDRT